MTHPIFDEPESKPNYLKVAILLVLLVIGSIYVFRIHTMPPLHREMYVVTVNVMRDDMLSVNLYVDRETKLEKSDLAIPVWIVLGEADYTLVNSTLISTQRLTWEEYQSAK
jgi:hypothetical protein